ncbi:hypothetical protein ACKWTF_001286 [Chironomus riparius]
MDYLFKLFCVIAIASLSAAQDEYFDTVLQDTTQDTVDDETTITPIESFKIEREKHIDSTLELEPAEVENVKSAGFYSFIQYVLYKDDSYRKYPRRIDCIIETLKKSNAINEVSTDEMNVKFMILETTNSSVTVAFKDDDGFKQDIGSNIESANYGCLVPGLVSVIILASILLALISLVICTNRNNPLPSEA